VEIRLLAEGDGERTNERGAWVRYQIPRDRTLGGEGTGRRLEEWVEW
jgi:hypothetical protein